MSWKFPAKISLCVFQFIILSVHNILILTNLEIKICQNYWENHFKQEIHLRKREIMFKWKIPLTFSYHSLSYFILFFSNSLTDKTKTECKPLSYSIIKVSWLLILTLFLTAEGTRQIYSLWRSNQFPGIFLRGFNNFCCPRTTFMDRQCVNVDSFWPATVSLPSFISSLLSLQSQN